MVSTLDSGESGPGSSPGREHCVAFLDKTLYSHSASLSTQMYNWVPGWGWPCDGLTSHPGGSTNTPSRFMLWKLVISSGLLGH